MKKLRFPIFLKISILICSVCFLPSILGAQTLIAGWDFQTTTNGGTLIAAAPNTPTTIIANFGTGSIYLNGSNGSSSWTTSTSGNELNAFGGTTLNNGVGFSTNTTLGALALVNSSANNKKLVFSFDMLGYTDLVVSYATQKTSTGFSSQLWEYSLNGTSWTAVQSVNTMTTSFSTQTLSTISALNNQSNVFLRLTVSGASATNGNNRLDNIQLNATPSSLTPLVTSNSSTATVGVPYSYSIAATNSPTSYATSALPAGLSLTANTGIISGTPQTSFSGSISLSATNGAGTGNGNLSLTINPGSQSITFGALSSMTYGDGAINLSATSSASLPITYSSSNTNVATISGNVMTIVGPGSVTITASQSGNVNYNAAADVSQSFSVAPKNLQVTGITVTPKMYDGTNVANLNMSGASLLTIVGSDVVNVTGSATYSSVSVGTAIQVNTLLNLTGADSYKYTLTSPSLTGDITLATQTIIFNPLPIVNLGTAPFTLNATGGNSGNPILFASDNAGVISITGNIATVTGTGIANITASQTGNSNYAAATNVVQSQSVINQTLLAGWDFQTTTNGGTIALASPNSPTVFQSNIGNGVLYLNGTNGASSWVAASSNNQLTAFNGTTINAGAGFSTNTTLGALALVNQSANGQSIVFKFSMLGYTNLSVSYATQKSASGFDSQLWEYSTNGTTWNNIQTITPIPTSFGLQTLNIITGLDNAFDAYLRLTFNGASSSNANNRIDNIQLKASTTVPCGLTLNATSTPIACFGGNSTLTATPSNGVAPYLYHVNGGANQSSNTFSNLLANTYTIQVSDANFCIATTTLTITEPAQIQVSATSVNGCIGVPVTLDGSPLGGTFSVANPYSGPSTTYTYTYTDNIGCTVTSAPATISLNACTIINLKLFLQGYYTGSSTMAPVLMNQGVGNDINNVDDILVELHDVTSFALVASTTAMLKTNGDALAAFSQIQGSYYLVIKHRNSILTCSALPVLVGSTPITYDFTDANTKAYNENMVEVEPGIWAIYSCDVNQDGYVDGFDYPDFDTDSQLGLFLVYTGTDFNGDGYVDGFDYPVYDLNAQNGVTGYSPPSILFPEDMESGTKSTYTTAIEILNSGSWILNDALIGSSSSDRKNGLKSARIQNTGKLSMNFDVMVDMPTVSVFHAKYGTDATSTWALFSSTNSGSSWTQVGSITTTSSTALSQSTFTLNYTGSIRFEIRKLSGGTARINLDDFSISNGNSIVAVNDNDPLIYGNPSNAITDISYPNNYLVVKPQYDLAYNNSRGTAAWVAWHFDINDRGTTPRCDCFATDISLPSSFYRANAYSYSGSGFDRGHMQPSAQRTNNITNNAATFLMSNMLPQSPNLNQITWNNLEQYCITLANSGYELYTYSGGYGIGGTGSNGGVTNTIDNGNITVSSRNWKIIVILTAGNNDLSRVDANTRVIAVDFPNNQTVNNQSWGYYRTSVDAIEAATGFDFFTAVSSTIQNTLEAIIDNGPTN